MSNLPESPEWVDGIYQLEQSDPVLGGPGGIANRQAEQLANRTAYLKQAVDTLAEGAGAHEESEDPHPQYLTKLEGDQLYRSLSSAVSKGGDTMEGTLTLAGNPSQAMHAVPKQYVDAVVGQGNAAVRKPANTTPAANAAGVSTTITLSASAYYSLYGIAQSAAQFQVSTVADFSSTVRDTTLGAVTSWAVSPALSSSTQYYWRVRYKDAENTWSDWSTPTLFSTGVAVITQPSLTSPASGATGISRTPTLTSSAFAVTGGADTHASSRWQVATDAAFTNLVVDSGNSTAAKTSYTLGINLAYGTTYYARVMHTGATLGGSSWSAAIAFSILAGEIAAPSITAPTEGATGVSLSPALATTAFSFTGANDTHQATNWEIRTAPNGGGTLIWSSPANTSNKVNITAAGLSNLTTYYARARHKGANFGYGPWSADVSFTTVVAAGEAVFTAPGTYNWTVPAGVSSVSVVCVGGGASGFGYYDGGTYRNTGGDGGGGGGLTYANNISVSPGSTITITVGVGGNGAYGVQESGGQSEFNYSGGNVIARGANGRYGGAPGSYPGSDGASFPGGNGGTGYGGYGGGGAAAGYNGNGGNGGWNDGHGLGQYGDPTTGAGGTTGGSWGNGGQGISLFGQGATTTPMCGAGGQGGNGTFGNGRPGGVRVIWGSGRRFPSNAA